MGIPKFFRYISERYPLTTQLVEENKIPEFDNLYLDFNGIIHNCSHPNDNDAHFRMSEERIFTSIFSYVDHLFGRIKPKKLFFVAVDGVAPRAKMNQQRSRRFRSAKEAEEVYEKAMAKGERLPAEKAFDSNCITPGTVFMTKLSEHLRYFINKKITEDAHWRDIQVVLSGHEVPGEGEHKIMEYIRLSRAQPDYDPNIRHCLYGLDADLIMLGLLSHDPHFCLLREEVSFGSFTKKKAGKLESQKFYLLHLSVMREYLNLEFGEIEHNLSFDYSLERVIDDFILLAVFIGNDFLPNLPDLYIHENGLERLFEAYKEVLPSLDGFLNESGTIDMKRLQALLNKMTTWEREIFEKKYWDAKWFKGKQRKNVRDAETAHSRTGLVLTRTQRDIFDKVKMFVVGRRGKREGVDTTLTMPNVFSSHDHDFISTLSNELRLSVTWDEYDDEDQNLVTWRYQDATEEPTSEPEVKDDVQREGASEEEDEESRIAIDRVLKEYEKAPVKDDEDERSNARYEESVDEKMDEWKREYYKEKLNISFHNPEEMGSLIFRYAEGLQWVMHYYYRGVASWGWFYRYHYAPRISDLVGLEEMQFEFELGKPFRPFEQLMGVLPSASKELIPLAYRDLMYDPSSHILDFYPVEFEQDLNGKKRPWEAVIKIPFIDEDRLIRAMASREHRLTAGEKRRNTIGTSTKFSFSVGEPTVYQSSLPNVFPTLYHCTCVVEPFDLPTLDGLRLVPGLRDGVFLGAEALAGFPSLNTLPHTASLSSHSVSVHGSETHNRTMVVHIQNPHEHRKSEEIAKEMVGKRTFIGWPFLREGRVVAVSDSLSKYEENVRGSAPNVVSNPHTPTGRSQWKTKTERIKEACSKKCGVITGDVDVLVHVRPLKGMKRLESGALVKDYEGPEKEVEQAVQMVISQVASEDPRFLEKEPPPLSEEFPDGCDIFFLGADAYGAAAQVANTTNETLSVALSTFPSEKAENDRFKAIVQKRASQKYYPLFEVAKMLHLTHLSLSKITSSFMVLMFDSSKVNLGLSLKFETKSLKVIDYSRKEEGRQNWELSEKAIVLIREYKEKFPEVFRATARKGNDMIRASDVFGKLADARVKEVTSWLKSKGVRDFEPVSLFSDQLAKETVREIEAYADNVNKNRPNTTMMTTTKKNVPRHAVLKPSHAIYRLQNQRFALGDRVRMVQDSGSVPLSTKGVVIGLNSKSMDVVWDVAFMTGITLDDRCSEHRGATVSFNSCLNLSNPQFISSAHPKSAPPLRPNMPFKPRVGPRPVIRPAPGQQAAAGFRPAPQRQQQSVPVTTNNQAFGGGLPNRPPPPRGSYTAAAVGEGAGGSAPVPASNNASGGYGNQANWRARRGWDPVLNSHAPSPSQSHTGQHSNDATTGLGNPWRTRALNQDRGRGQFGRGQNPEDNNNSPTTRGSQAGGSVRGFNNNNFSSLGTRGSSIERGGERGGGGYRGRGRGGVHAVAPSW